MTNTSRNVAAFGAGLLLPGIAAAAWFAVHGITAESIAPMLRLTARLAVLLYAVVFVARPLRELTQTQTAIRLVRYRRLIGVGLAGVMTAHLALIACKRVVVPDWELALTGLLGGIGAYLLLYLMLITSFDRPAAAIGRTAWRRLHKTGLYWLGAIYSISIFPYVPRHLDEPLYLAVAAALLGAILVRVLAFLRR